MYIVNKKKLFLMTLAVFLGVMLTACSGEKPEQKTETSQPQTKEEEKKSDEAHWSYNGQTGPENWAELSSEFKKCERGKEQSPVDIKTSKLEKKPKKVQFEYESTSFEIVNNGHAIQANAKGQKNNAFRLDRKEYQLGQSHFHAPSEHTVNGEHYDMEMHLVHKSKEGKLAVVTFFVEEGKENKTLKGMWSNLPKQKGETSKLTKKINPAHFISENQQAYIYNGSLTTPPCSEGVKWLIFKKPLQMSKEQINRFKEIHSHTNRPTQELNEREVSIVE
ncbi:carbonic anhydrase [Virgibacillus necropolis]|uniref:Carbonic anhydrase n=1 Tax=Virgibacillus necropolis TaxID=163877 RepID=A0A221MC69_9BACI|nr:carbonic anhydrase family protein [Virgibacillus necropolis]ASN05268.1 carbonic anhydrase [Virgibacillus necropolis]